MAIYLTKESKVLVQGMTLARGHEAHPPDAGRGYLDVVGGVNPRKAGRTVDFEDLLNRFGFVREGIESMGADVTVVFVPPAFAKAAVVEAADVGIGLAVVITEGIPVHDAVAFTAHARAKGTRVIGPNRPWPMTPASPTRASSRPTSPGWGCIGLVSKSGTLTYQLMYQLRDIGFSTCVGIGGYPVVGTSHIDCRLIAFEDDPDTELDHPHRRRSAATRRTRGGHIRRHVTKPVVGYIAGFTAPEGRTMGYAGAIVSLVLWHGAGEEGGAGGGGRTGR
ncbi:succinate--CoA ligase subunit alpha [Streptomyces violaceorubidus]